MEKKVRLMEDYLKYVSTLAFVILIWWPKTVESGLEAICGVAQELDAEERSLGFGNIGKKLYLVIPEHAVAPSALLYCGMMEVEWKKAGISFDGHEFNHVSDCVSSEANLNVRFITTNWTVVRDTEECTDRLKCSPSSSSDHQFTIAPRTIDGSRYLEFSIDSGIPYRRLLIGIRQRALCFDIPLENATAISPFLWILLAGMLLAFTLPLLFCCLTYRSPTIHQIPTRASARMGQVDLINSLQRGCMGTARYTRQNRRIMLMRIERVRQGRAGQV